jgi:hypothetical protein
MVPVRVMLSDVFLTATAMFNPVAPWANLKKEGRVAVLASEKTGFGRTA